MRITIVGAGAIGCYLGRLLRKYGFSPLILEEHSEIGVPKHCAGLVGSSFFTSSRVSLPQDIIIKNQVDGAIISYQNQSFMLKREKVAFVIDREKLDKKLSEGLEVKKEAKLLTLEKKGEEYLLYTNKGTFRSTLVVGADGATSTVRKISRLKLKPTYFRGIQFRIHQKITPQNMVQVDFTRPFLHFCWLIPEDEKIIRVGSISPDPLKSLESFMKKKKIKGKIIEKMGGILSIGYGEICKEGIFLVGDAACQVKPLSGGGLYYGMRGAEILADCIKEGNLSSYNAKWKKGTGKEIKSALKIRKILEKTSLTFLKNLFNLVQKNSHLIEEFADFEHHSVGVFAVIKRLGIALPGTLLKTAPRSEFP